MDGNSNAGKAGAIDSCMSTGKCIAKNTAGAIQCSNSWWNGVCLSGGKCVDFAATTKVG